MKRYKLNRILITGGVHGDEPTGIRVAKYFADGKLKTHGLVCNKEAVLVKKRFIETDLNRSFKVKTPISLEEQVAEVISKSIKRYSLVIDIHNTKAAGTTCAIIVSKPNNYQLKLISYLGFSKVVIMPPSGSLISVKPKISFSLEISMDLIDRYSAFKLINKINTLNVNNKNLHIKNITIYLFVNKILTKTLQRIGIDKNELHNFALLTKKQKQKLKLDNCKYCPIFLKKESEEIAFTLVKEIDVK